MNEISSVPFERKTLFLKQVRVAELDEIEKLALDFFFPGYHEGSGFEENKLSEHSLLKPAKDAGFTVIRDKNQARRYAGDFSLPRSSYFTVCRNEKGDDRALLLRELKTYSRPHQSGYVNFFDTTDPDERIKPLREMLKPGKS